MLNAVNIRFPHLEINIGNLIRGFKIFGIEISMDSVMIAVGILAGFLLIIYEVKRTWQDMDTYINLSICVVLTGIIGGRLYYAILNWDYYKKNLLQIFNIQNGGLAIYGGIIAAVITCIIFAGIKKISFWQIADTACIGVVLGQAIRVWGHFFDRTAFGSYTDTLFAMQIKYDEVGGIMNQEILDHLIRYDGMIYIQVHPVFLYESIWCLILFVVLMLCRRFKKFEGEVFLWYVGGYSMGRVWIEGIRINKVMIPGIHISIFQVLALLFMISAFCIFIVKHIKVIREEK